MADFASAFLARDQSTATDFDVVSDAALQRVAGAARRPYQYGAIKARARLGTVARLDRSVSARGI